MFPLGSEIRPAREGLALYEARNVKKEDFDADKVKADRMTIAAWSKCYLEIEQVKKQRALSRTRDLIAAIKRHLGDVLLTDVKREHLFRYRNERLQEHIIRAGKPAAKTISVGTVAKWSFLA